MNNETPARGVPPVSEVFADEPLRRAAAAAELGDVEQIRALSAVNAVDLNAEQPAGVNLLMYELAAGNETAVRTLLDAGADPNALTKTGASPMLVAGATGEPRWLGLLLDKGGDPNLKNHKGEPLLTRLVFEGAWDNILLLLDRGARIDEAGPSGQTATFLLGSLHQFERVNTMLDRGADPSVTDKNGLQLRSFVEQRLAPDSPEASWHKRVAERLGLSSESK